MKVIKIMMAWSRLTIAVGIVLFLQQIVSLLNAHEYYFAILYTAFISTIISLAVISIQKVKEEV